MEKFGSFKDRTFGCCKIAKYEDPDSEIYEDIIIHKKNPLSNLHSSIIYNVVQFLPINTMICLKATTKFYDEIINKYDILEASIKADLIKTFIKAVYFDKYMALDYIICIHIQKIPIEMIIKAILYSIATHRNKIAILLMKYTDFENQKCDLDHCYDCGKFECFYEYIIDNDYNYKFYTLPMIIDICCDTNNIEIFEYLYQKYYKIDYENIEHALYKNSLDIIDFMISKNIKIAQKMIANLILSNNPYAFDTLEYLIIKGYIRKNANGSICINKNVVNSFIRYTSETDDIFIIKKIIHILETYCSPKIVNYIFKESLKNLYIINVGEFIKISKKIKYTDRLYKVMYYLHPETEWNKIDQDIEACIYNKIKMCNRY